MRTHKIRTLLSTALVLALAGGLVGCKKGGKGTKGPGKNQELADASEAEVPDEQAKADFAKAFAAYEAAKKDGSLSAGECESIASEFDKVYQSNKRSMLVARFNVGALWEECGNMEKAAEIYEDLGKKNFHLAINNLGVIEWRKGNTKKALDMFQASIDADKKQAFAARNNLAAAYRDRYADKVDIEDFKVAEQQIQNVLAVDTSNKAAYENLARLYYDRGRLADQSYLVLANLVVTQALRVLEKEGQESADIWNLKGLLFMQQDNQIDALKAFKKAVEIDGQHEDANLNIAFISVRFRDYAAAEKSLDIALKYDRTKRDVEAYLVMGVTKRGLKKYKEAEEFYKKALEVEKSDARAWYNLGILNQEHLIGQEDVDQAKIEEYYNIAKEHYGKFVKAAEGKKALAEQVKDASDRIIIIDDAIESFRKMEELEKLAKELEEKAKKAEEEERKRLLELERQAMEAEEAGAAAPPAKDGG